MALKLWVLDAGGDDGPYGARDHAESAEAFSEWLRRGLRVGGHPDGTFTVEDIREATPEEVAQHEALLNRMRVTS